MSQPREKFATQVNSSILSAVRSLAQSEGRQLQALVEEALADLIEKHKTPNRARMSWALISPAMTNTAPFTRSLLNDRLPHAGRDTGHA
jgi:hypothetical protein